jgi:fatty-acyl-CoA synthase
MVIMKFCFSTLACPGWTFPTVIARAKEFGYSAIDLRGFLNETDFTACNPFLSDPKKLRRLFETANTEIACLSSGISLDADETRRFIDLAPQLSCRHVRILDLSLKQGDASTLCEFLLPLADYAADRHVTILVENAISLCRASDLWRVLDRLNHPGIAASLNVPSAQNAGESLDVILTLARWLRLVKLHQIDRNTPDLIHRLRGVGYSGYLSIESEKLYLPDLPEPEDLLPAALETMRLK